VNILICSSEAVPFAKTGGLADVAGALPKALSALGHDVRLALPKYGMVYDRKISGTKVLDGLQIPAGAKARRVTVQSSNKGGDFLTYLIVNDPLFRRNELYGHPDDDERFVVYQRAVLEMLRKIDWKPDVIHCNDWQTGLMPVYLRTKYAADERLGQIPVLYTVHNLAYQGVFEPTLLNLAELPQDLLAMDKLEFWGKVNCMKGGLIYADVLSTVSPTYSREIQTPEFGAGLDGVLRDRKDVLFGVLNGIDFEEWNPATDKYIPVHFDATCPEKKRENKAHLQDKMRLPRKSAPIFGLVSRLAAQKGLDILMEAMPRMLGKDLQVVVLGSGDDEYHQALRKAQAKFPEKVYAEVGVFDEALARLIYAGSDFFLMPSHYEPCGLGQMNSMRYGTIPVVRSTGGLADTVQEFDPITGRGNGFVFSDYTAAALLSAVERALATYADPSAQARLIANAMAADFTWARSAREYVALYEKAISLRR